MYTGLQELVVKIKAGDEAALASAKAYAGEIPSTSTATTVIAYLEGLIADAKKAENESVADAGSYFTSTTVEGALQEVGASLGTLNGDASTTGSVAKALADAKSYTDTEIGELKIGTTEYDTVKAYVDAKDTAIVKLIDSVNGDLSSLTTDVKTDLVQAINEVDAHADANAAAIGTATKGETAGTGLTKRVEDLEASIGTGGSVDTKIKTAIEALDTSADIALASASNGIVTIKAVKEADGVIAASTDTTLDVTLAKVATTGAAEDVSVADTAGKITATTVEGALAEIVGKADANATAITTLNGAVTEEGSVKKTVYDSAKNAVYSDDGAGNVVTIASAIATAQGSAAAAIADLDATVSQTAGTDGLALQVVEENGKLTSVTGSIAANTYDAYGAASAVDDKVTILNGTVDTTGSVLKMIKDNAGDADSDVTVVDKYEEIANPGTYITVDAYNALSETDKAKYQAVNKTLTLDEAIADAKASATKGSVVDVVKLGTATEGYAASYAVKQNGVQVGATIDIPKDYLVKSAKLVHYVASETTGKYYEIVSDPEKKTLVDLPSYISADQVGKDLIDFTVNASEGTGTESHVIIDVTHLVDVYQGVTVTDGISTSVSEDYKISATVSGKAIARENITDGFEADIAALEATHAKDGDNFKTVAAEIAADAQDATYTDAAGTESTIKAAIQALEASSGKTNGAFVFKGSVAALPTTGSVGDAYLLTGTNMLYICTTASVADPATNAVYTQIADNGEFTVGNDTLSHSVSLKAYIDSRIFIGTQTEVDTAKAAGTIDDSTFVVVTDEDSQELVAVTNDEIDALFA